MSKEVATTNPDKAARAAAERAKREEEKKAATALFLDQIPKALPGFRFDEHSTPIISHHALRRYTADGIGTWNGAHLTVGCYIDLDTNGIWGKITMSTVEVIGTHL